MTGEQRNKLLAIIHIGKKDACLSDADYKAVLRQVVGVESSKDCNISQLKKLADHFKSFTKPKRRNDSDNYYHITEGIANWRQLRHIAGLWVELGFKASGLDIRAKKQFGKERFTKLSLEDLQTLGRDLAKRAAKKKRAAGGKD